MREWCLGCTSDREGWIRDQGLLQCAPSVSVARCPAESARLRKPPIFASLDTRVCSGYDPSPPYGHLQTFDAGHQPL